MSQRCVIFDLGNVVNFWEPEAALQGLYPSQQALANAIERHRFHDWVSSVLDAGGDVDVSITDIERTSLERAALLRTYMDNIGLAHANPVPGTCEIIQELSKAGHCKLLGMTNAGVAAFETMRSNFPVINSFEDIFVSAVEKCMKPDAIAFERLLQRNGLAPEECLFVDDSRKNVEGAQALGITAVRFESAEQLRLKLQELGLLEESVAS